MCPIFLNADDGEGMAVEARWSWLNWWFDVNEAIFASIVFVVSAFNPTYEPMFPFKVTGKLQEKNH